MASRIDGDVQVLGSLVASGGFLGGTAYVRNADVLANAEIERSKLEQNQLAPFPVELTSLRVHDEYHTNLPGTAASDDLALIGGTFGSAGPSVRTSDLKNTTGTQYARFQVDVPAEYDDGQTFNLRFLAGMITTVANGTATLDVEVYKISKTDGSVGSDLCATAAQSINSLTPAEKVFVITPTGLVAGDKLDVRITIAITDSATGTAVIGCVYQIDRLADIRG